MTKSFVYENLNLVGEIAEEMLNTIKIKMKNGLQFKPKNVLLFLNVIKRILSNAGNILALKF